MPRFHVPAPLSTGHRLALPPGPARHVQVLRLQPGAAVTLFDGTGGEWDARIALMGRATVEVEVGAHHAIEREATRAVHLAVGLMAAERMDWLVEKATELGVASLTPVLTARSNVRLDDARTDRKRARWQALAAAACEQCGRNRLPVIHPVVTLADFLGRADGGVRGLLTLAADADGLHNAIRTLPEAHPVTLLSGPEGGLDPQEEAAARQAGLLPITLGTRVLRAETAPLAALAVLLCGG